MKTKIGITDFYVISHNSLNDEQLQFCDGLALYVVHRAEKQNFLLTFDLGYADLSEC